jgi:hypothetical protein
MPGKGSAVFCSQLALSDIDYQSKAKANCPQNSTGTQIRVPLDEMRRTVETIARWALGRQDVSDYLHFWERQWR